jgi:hypothetical protein
VNALGLIALLALMLAACGGETQETCSAPLSQAAVDGLYLNAEACTGVTAAPPSIVYENYIGPAGAYGFATHEVLLNTNGNYAQDCATVASVLRHEFVHHLLNAADLPIDDNRTHKSPLFGLCG